VGYVAGMGRQRNVYRILDERHEGKRPFRRHWHRWEDNVEMVLMEIGMDSLDWIHLAQDSVWRWAFVNMGMNLWFP
jgi:hypothetical protein